MRKTIELTLSEAGIDRAIAELKAYRVRVKRKTQELSARIASELSALIEANFSGVMADEYFNKAGTYAKAPEYTIGVDGSGNTRVVWAAGEDVIFAEFGTGVYYNGGAGSSPHPKGSELGFTIGSYGEGKGKQTTWGFYRDGETYLTHGIPAAMPLYKAAQQVAREIERIAREVFGS